MESRHNHFQKQTDQDNSYIPLKRYTVSSYGVDLDVDGLVRKMDKGEIFVPSFQRAYVWKPNQASQFIESILLGLPVPGIILAVDDSEGKRYIVDGLQRLTTLSSFIKGVFPNKKQFTLSHVQDEFENKTFSQLTENDQRIILNYVIHATIIKQEKPDNEKTGIYAVFRRLNTGGTQLTPQEIRSAIYNGSFNENLGYLAQHEISRNIFSSKSSSTQPDRKKNEELILRFLAFYHNYELYKRPLEIFLNKFMSDHQNADESFIKEQNNLFLSTMNEIYNAIGKSAFRTNINRNKQFNRAVFDAVMVGVAKRLQTEHTMQSSELEIKYNNLMKNETFIKLIGGPTSDESNVVSRISICIDAFAFKDNT